MNVNVIRLVNNVKEESDCRVWTYAWMCGYIFKISKSYLHKSLLFLAFKVFDNVAVREAVRCGLGEGFKPPESDSGLSIHKIKEK